MPSVDAVVTIVDTSDFMVPETGNWNIIPNALKNGEITNLTDFDTGVGTGIAIAGMGWDLDGQDPAVWTDTLGIGVPDELGDDGFGTTSSASFTFKNLDSNVDYAIQVISAWIDDSAVSTIKVNGFFADATLSGSTVSLGNDWLGATHGNDNILLWNRVTPNTLNEIVVAFDLGTGGDYAAVNGIGLNDIAIIPEPVTTYAVMLIVVGGWFVARTRKRTFAS